MVEIVEHKMDGSELVLTLEGDTPVELVAAAARQLAIDAAPNYGMQLAGVSRMSGVYPAGLESMATIVTELKPAKSKKFRNDIHLLSRG